MLAALAIYGDLDDARGQADALGMLATLRMERGEPESAEKDYKRAIAVSQRIGYRHGEAVNQMNLGILFVITNQLGEALRMFDASAETYGLMGNARGRALVQSNAAWMRHSRLGKDLEAETALLDALTVHETIGDQRGIAQCTGVLASIKAPWRARRSVGWIRNRDRMRSECERSVARSTDRSRVRNREADCR